MGTRNLIIVNDSANIDGGAGQVAFMSAYGLKRFARADYNIFIFTAQKSDNSYGENKYLTPDMELAHTGSELITARTFFRLPKIAYKFGNYAWSEHNRRSMQRFISSHEFSPRNTIVHFHSWTKALTPSVFEPLTSAGFPIVITLHEYFTSCPTGGFFDYNRREICTRIPFSAECNRCNCVKSGMVLEKKWRHRRLKMQIERAKVPSGVNDFIYISEFSKAIFDNYAPSEDFYSHAAFHHVKNPVEIDDPEKARQHPAAPADNDKFLFIGRASPEKGFRELLDAAADYGISLLIAGTSPETNALISSKMYPSPVYAGWVVGKAKSEFYRRGRVLVLPSLWYETMGLVVLEAAAHGIPSLVPKSSAAAEFVEHNQSGLHFDWSMAGDFIEKLQLLKRDNDLVARLGRQAHHNFWNGSWMLPDHVAQLEKVYDCILSSN